MTEKYAHRRSKANLLARELIGRPEPVQLRVIKMFSAELHVENLPLKMYLVTSKNDEVVSWKNTALMYKAMYDRQEARWANMTSRKRQHYEHQLSLIRMKIYSVGGRHGHYGESNDPMNEESHKYVFDMLPWLSKVTGGYDADSATYHPDITV